MAEGFEIAEYKLLPDTATNAMSSVAAAITLTFRPGYEPEEESASGLKSLLPFLTSLRLWYLKDEKRRKGNE